MKPPRCRWPETACRPRGDIYNGGNRYSFFKEMHMASGAVSIGLTFVCAATLSACAGNREIPAADLAAAQDRKSVVSGKSVSVRVDLGGRRIIKKKKKQ